MHYACRCDEFVRRVADEIKACGHARHGEVDGPQMDAVQSPGHLPVIKIEGYTAELHEFREFPRNDGG